MLYTHIFNALILICDLFSANHLKKIKNAIKPASIIIECFSLYNILLNKLLEETWGFG